MADTLSTLLAEAKSRVEAATKAEFSNLASNALASFPSDDSARKAAQTLVPLINTAATNNGNAFEDAFLSLLLPALADPSAVSSVHEGGAGVDLVPEGPQEPLTSHPSDSATPAATGDPTSDAEAPNQMAHTKPAWLAPPTAADTPAHTSSPKSGEGVGGGATLPLSPAGPDPSTRQPRSLLSTSLAATKQLEAVTPVTAVTGGTGEGEGAHRHHRPSLSRRSLDHQLLRASQQPDPAAAAAAAGLMLNREAHISIMGSNANARMAPLGMLGAGRMPPPLHPHGSWDEGQHQMPVSHNPLIGFGRGGGEMPGLPDALAAGMGGVEGASAAGRRVTAAMMPASMAGPPQGLLQGLFGVSQDVTAGAMPGMRGAPLGALEEGALWAAAGGEQMDFGGLTGLQQQQQQQQQQQMMGLGGGGEEFGSRAGLFASGFLSPQPNQGLRRPAWPLSLASSPNPFGASLLAAEHFSKGMQASLFNSTLRSGGNANLHLDPSAHSASGQGGLPTHHSGPVTGPSFIDPVAAGLMAMGSDDLTTSHLPSQPVTPTSTSFPLGPVFGPHSGVGWGVSQSPTGEAHPIMTRHSVDGSGLGLGGGLWGNFGPIGARQAPSTLASAYGYVPGGALRGGGQQEIAEGPASDQLPNAPSFSHMGRDAPDATPSGQNLANTLRDLNLAPPGTTFASPGTPPSSTGHAALAAGHVTLSPATSRPTATITDLPLPTRFRPLPPAVQARILALCHTNPVITIRDFDDKVASKLALLVEQYGQREALAMLDHLEHRMRTKQGAMKNGPGYLDVAVCSHLDMLKAQGSCPKSMPLPEYAKQALPPQVFQELREAVNNNRWLEWEHFDQGIVQLIKRLPKDSAVEKLQDISYHSFKNVDNIKGCIMSILNSKIREDRRKMM